MIRSLSAAFVLAIACIASPSAPASDEPLAGLDAAIERAREQWHAPGLAVAIVKDDQVVYARGFGTKHLGRNDPVDAHTLFTLASTTKAFTAIALGLLVDEGKLRWDDPVVRHIPEFRVADPYVTREVTVRDLLVHRTGIEEMDILWVRGYDTRTSIEHMQYATQASSLRSSWVYNNSMYVVAAEVVARVSGMTFQEFVARRIFAPLGMSDSLFTGPELSEDANATGAHLISHGVVRATEPHLSPHPLGASGIQSSATDLAKWLRMLLSKGAAPVEFRHAFMYDVVDRFLGSRDKDWNADLLKLYGGLQVEEDARRAAAWRARPANTRPSLPLAGYAGTYFDELVGETQIVLGKDGTLTLAIQPGVTFALSHWSYDSFAARETHKPDEDVFRVTFARGADGRITGYETDGGRVFRRR